jgi:NAD(P)-dependent dehydrogenase (short-subunit alcohol dehydrogenase family)
LAVQCDVLNKDAVARFAAAVEQWMGRCDILVNNAGQARMSTFANTTDEAWREELELKFFSQIYPVRAFKPMLDKSDAAAIIAVNSLLAYQPEPYMVATAAARAGAQSLVKSLAREFAPRIRVNSVLLGLIDSGQWERRFVVRENKAQTREEWFANVARERHIPLERLASLTRSPAPSRFSCRSRALSRASSNFGRHLAAYVRSSMNVAVSAPQSASIGEPVGDLSRMRWLRSASPRCLA